MKLITEHYVVIFECGHKADPGLSVHLMSAKKPFESQGSENRADTELTESSKAPIRQTAFFGVRGDFFFPGQ